MVKCWQYVVSLKAKLRLQHFLRTCMKATTYGGGGGGGHGGRIETAPLFLVANLLASALAHLPLCKCTGKRKRGTRVTGGSTYGSSDELAAGASEGPASAATRSALDRKTAPLTAMGGPHCGPKAEKTLSGPLPGATPTRRPFPVAFDFAAVPTRILGCSAARGLAFGLARAGGGRGD